MEFKDISGAGDGAGPSSSQPVEVLPPPPNPPEMAPQSRPSSSEPVEVLPAPSTLPPQMAQKLLEVPRVVIAKRPNKVELGDLLNYFVITSE